MRPREVEALLLCARLTIGPEERARLEDLISQDLDWSRLLALASRHALSPLLYRNLIAAGQDGLPRGAYVALWAQQECLRRRNGVLAKELRSVLEAFDAAGILALPYKGPALAAAVYGDVDLRVFNDLDVLVRPGDLQAAMGVLRRRGYRTEPELPPALEAAFLRSRSAHHVVLFRTGDMPDPREDTVVELHWKTDADHPLDEAADDAWWAGLGEAAFLEGRVRCFAPRELLLVLCLHGSKHHWSHLAWLVDVAELVRQQPGLDWNWTFARAERTGCTRGLALGLFLAHQLLDAPVPDGVLGRVRETPGVEALARRLAGLMMDPASTGPGPLLRLRLDLALKEGLARKLSHAVRLLLAPSLEEWTRWPLPRPLFLLYPPLRLYTLIERNVLRRRA